MALTLDELTWALKTCGYLLHEGKFWYEEQEKKCTIQR